MCRIGEPGIPLSGKSMLYYWFFSNFRWLTFQPMIGMGFMVYPLVIGIDTALVSASKPEIQKVSADISPHCPRADAAKHPVPFY